MSNEKKYWKGIEDLQNDPAFLKLRENEFPEELPVNKFLGDNNLENTKTPRRDFLKFLGFGVTAATLASCETPVTKAIPYLIKPEEITPGVANWYASNYYDGNDYCDVLIKTREGRPIKVEGNPLSPITKGGVNARVQASVLSLYDSGRLNAPVTKGNPSTWDEVDTQIKSQLQSISAAGRNIRILSSSIISPSAKAVIKEFTSKYPTTKHITYDAVSYSGIIQANKNSFGKAIIPQYRFDKANVIVSFGADFLINWVSPVEYAAQYIANRKLDNKKEMSRHIQLETHLSVTGSNADLRIPVKPSEQTASIISLYNNLAGLAGKTKVNPAELAIEKEIKNIAAELWKNKGKSLVISGSNDAHEQFLVNEINSMLTSYGNTIDLETPVYLKQGNDNSLAILLDELKKEEVGALIIYNSNPVYTLPADVNFLELIKKVDLKISLADRIDETAELVDFVCPDHHSFESWNDAQPRKGVVTLTQPVISPIYNTRSAAESLLKWSGSDATYHNYIKAFWQKEIFTKQSKYTFFDGFWNASLHDGIFESEGLDLIAEPVSFSADEIKIGLPAVSLALAKKTKTTEGFELVIYEKAGIGNGKQANNPWLQELPDPVTKITWDNYVTMSPKQMAELGFNAKQGQEELADVVTVSVNGKSLKLPVVSMPGQAYNTIGIALGYGRTKAGKAADNIGANAYILTSLVEKSLQYSLAGVSVSSSIEKYNLAATQTHHTMMGRDLVKETILSEYINNPASGNAPKTIAVKEDHNHVQKPVKEVDLWKNYEENGHFWNLSIDLNSCIGCGACVVSCQAENNVPVVGKDEVRRGREMHWMRIDRYYSSDAAEDNLLAMEVPSENPQVVYQPLMCQHCNHAPCETVCPVIATSHSTDGLNQMTYNRCVGTRYCANNCPYKVRRFNWFTYSDNAQFDFNMNDSLGKMVLNPDVVVRSRGVMEKCSMCVQRIQGGKLKAKNENRPLTDGEIQTACSQSCPTRAITFGDKNLKDGAIAKHREDPRTYYLIEEVGTQPNVLYRTKVRNKTVKSHEI